MVEFLQAWNSIPAAWFLRDDLLHSFLGSLLTLSSSHAGSLPHSSPSQVLPFLLLSVLFPFVLTFRPFLSFLHPFAWSLPPSLSFSLYVCLVFGDRPFPSIVFVSLPPSPPAFVLPFLVCFCPIGLWIFDSSLYVCLSVFGVLPAYTPVILGGSAGPFILCHRKDNGPTPQGRTDEWRRGFRTAFEMKRKLCKLFAMSRPRKRFHPWPIQPPSQRPHPSDTTPVSPPQQFPYSVGVTKCYQTDQKLSPVSSFLAASIRLTTNILFAVKTCNHINQIFISRFLKKLAAVYP